MDPKEKAPAVDAAEATKAYDGGGLTHRQRHSANGTRSKVQSAAERLLELFAGNEHRHVKNFGPPVWDEEKHKWKTQIHNG